MTPGQRGREIGRWMIALAFAAIGLSILAFIAAPGYIGPMFSHPPDFLGVPVGMVQALVGFTGVGVGLAWMIRIHRAEPEPDQHAWHYRAPRPARPSRGAGMTPGQRGRVIARVMFGVAAAAIALTVLWIAISGEMEPMHGNPPAQIDWISGVPILGLIGAIVGSMWMFRIVREDPEPEQHAWRYRAHDR